MRSGCLILLMLSVPAGCATLKNTPQQDYVWEMGRICDSQNSFWKMESVRSDGSYTVRGATNGPPGSHDYLACMQEHMKAKPYGQWLKEQPPAR